MTSEQKLQGQRMVHCVKLNQEAPGLLKPPFSGALGQEIYEKVSAEAWKGWQDDVMIKVINEYRLNLADPQQYEMLLQQMRAFLHLDGKQQGMVEVENAERGRRS
jgi:Fe-S cluster biosynthesis and repair protein YggX